MKQPPNYNRQLRRNLQDGALPGQNQAAYVMPATGKQAVLQTALVFNHPSMERTSW